MTYPITPLKSIHNDPFNAALALQELRATLALLEKLLSQLAHDIIIGVVNAILNGLGLASFQGPVDALTSHLLGAITSLVSNPIGTFTSDFNTLITGIGGTAITDVVNLLLKIQQIIDTVAQVLNPTLGTNNPLSTLVSSLKGSLGGLFGQVFANFDGTATAVSGVIGNGDGTATGGPSLLGSNSIYSLFDNLDGTAMSVIDLMSNAHGAVTGGNLTKAVGNVQQVIDNVNNAVGVAGSGHPVESVVTALTAVPNGNVLGQIGATIGADVTGLAGVLGGLFGSIFGVSAPTNYAAMNNYVGPTALQLDTSATLSNAAAVALAAQAISNPSSWGIDPTADPVFNLHSLTGSAATTIPVTATTSAIGFIGAPNGTTKKSIAFLGYFTANTLNSVVINLYSVNVSTGALTFMFSSGNMIGGMSGGAAPLWTYYDFTAPQIFSTPTIASLANNQAVQADWYAVEMEVQGGGTFNLVGIPNHWLPANTSSAFPQQLGAKRTSLTAPAYGATGAGHAGASGSQSYTHTLLSTDDAIVVFVSGSSFAIPTVGGVATTQLGTITVGSMTVTAYGLLNPATGAQTVAVASSSLVAFDSISYSGVSAFGTPVTTSGTGTAFSQTFTTGVATDWFAQAFGIGGAATTSGYNQTQRSNQPQVGSVNFGLTTGDAAGGASVVFSETASASVPWGSIVVPLHGSVGAAANIAAPGPTGSSNIPWFALCGAAGISEQAPQTVSFLTAGSGQTYTPPVWAQQTVTAGGTIHFDLVGLGGGGSGAYPSSGSGYGNAGTAGSWNASRLTYGPGSSIPTSMSVTVGAGGASPGRNGALPGNAGGNSSISGSGITTLTASGGGGAATGLAGSYQAGVNPGNSSGPAGSTLGLTYTGGGSNFTDGTAPGGQGAGGENISGGISFNLAAGAGAQGAAFITCYQ